MRVIVAGSRQGFDQDYVFQCIRKSGFAITSIVSGCAKGPDSFAIQYAEANGIPVVKYPADWNRHGKSAGYKRNLLMAQNADALIAIWDGQSSGTRHMINIANQMNLKVCVFCPGG